MDVATVTEFLPAVALAIALAASAGLRAWMPLLLAGVAARLGLLELGPSFQFLASNKALVVFGLATAVELVGDKFPAVDHVLDVIGTVLRPAAGALLAASVLGTVTDPLTSVVFGTAIGAPSALVPHVAKSALRGVATTVTGGLANPLLSVIEDAITMAVFMLAVVVPLLVVLLLGLALYVSVRWIRRRKPAPQRA